MGETTQSRDNLDSPLVMAPAVIETGSGRVIVRPMDGDYVLAGDVLSANFFGQNGLCVSDGPLNPRTANPNLAVSALHRALAEQYDAPPILAWLDDLVVGFLNVFPEGLTGEKTCMLEEDLGKAGRIRREGLPRIDTDTLILGCLAVSPDVRSQGVGKALVRCLQRRVKGTRWKRLRTECRADNHPDRWKPQLSFWTDLGFRVIREPSEESAEREKQLFQACSICGAVRGNGEAGGNTETVTTYGAYLVEYTVE